MKNVAGMKIADSTKKLAHYVLFMNIFQNGHFLDYIVQICFHEFKHQVNIPENVLLTKRIWVKSEQTTKNLKFSIGYFGLQ